MTRFCIIKPGNRGFMVRFCTLIIVEQTRFAGDSHSNSNYLL